MSKEGLWSARCGRCAQILPDETTTYCPSCGVPYSRVPPTRSFYLFEEGAPNVNKRRWVRAAQVLSMMVTCFLVGAFAFESQIHESSLALREAPQLQVYSYDFDEFPKSSAWVKRQALAYATQGFEDHFDISLGDLNYHEKQIPKDLQFLNTHEGMALSRSLSFWEKIFFPALGVQGYATKPLSVFVTNIPIVADSSKATQVEVGHLAQSELVSGLGHPAYVIVSTYRMQKEVDTFRQRHASVDSSQDQARFLGEFVLAHELGHALLGLKDFVFDQPLKTSRGLASTGAASENFDECLMHSDRGGGFFSWQRIKEREAGIPSKCRSYEAMTEAFKIRAQAIRFLKQGRRAEAEALHQKAILLAQASAQGWVAELWKREQPVFQTVLRRWLNAFFVVKLNYDSSKSQP